MGILGKFFGKESAYPEIDNSVPEYNIVQSYKKHLEKFVETVTSDMEVLPFDDKLFFFIGNPPRNFGLAWIKDTYIYNLKGVASVLGEEISRIVSDL